LLSLQRLLASSLFFCLLSLSLLRLLGGCLLCCRLSFCFRLQPILVLELTHLVLCSFITLRGLSRQRCDSGLTLLRRQVLLRLIGLLSYKRRGRQTIRLSRGHSLPRVVDLELPFSALGWKLDLQGFRSIGYHRRYDRLLAGDHRASDALLNVDRHGHAGSDCLEIRGKPPYVFHSEWIDYRPRPRKDVRVRSQHRVRRYHSRQPIG
jgi:hypothetical protein